jgi:predicted transcriptional regulator
MDRNRHDLTGDLEALARRLRDDRPEITGLALDRIKRRAISQAAATAGSWAPKKGLFMKPRIAVALVLAMGLLTSGTGATLAVISESGSAAQVQYPDLKPKESIDPGVLGSDPGGGGSAVQEEQQVANSGGSELPFTGFLAIPLLVVGVVFLVTGGVLRSRASGDKTG